VFAPSDSTLPQYSWYRNTWRKTRKHSRLSLVAAAALAAGAYTAASVTGGTMPWAHTGSDVAASAHVASDVFGGRAGTAIVDDVTGHKSTAAPQAVQLDAFDARTTGGTATSPGTASTTVPASSWATSLAQTSLAQTPVAKTSVATSPAATFPVATFPVATTPVAQASAPGVSAARNYAAHAAAAPAARPVPVKGTVKQAGAVKPQAAPVHAAAAKPVAKPAAPPMPLPFTLYDSVTPSAIPWGRHVATYVNGNYAASAASVAGRGPVLWIDTNGSDPHASALDVEPGDVTPPGAAQWVQQKLSKQPNSVAIVYTMRSEWGAVKSNIAGLPSWMQARVRYWIADPTGVKHIVPGSSATQWYWGQNYDITAANGNFETP